MAAGTVVLIGLVLTPHLTLSQEEEETEVLFSLPPLIVEPVSRRRGPQPPPFQDSTPPETDELDIKALVESIAKSIVDSPERVVVSGVEGENSTVLELRVAKEDIGKVIGKNGRTITAMRTILNATRAQKFKRHILEVLE